MFALTRHGDLHVGGAVDDEVAGKVGCYSLEGAGEEGVGVVVGRDASAAVVTAGQSLGAEVGHCVRHVDGSDELLVDVESSPRAGTPFPRRSRVRRWVPAHSGHHLPTGT